MSKRDAVVLASRALALYLICWALTDMSVLPQLVIALRHHTGVLGTHDSWWDYYHVELTFYVVRIVALFLTAEWLIKCGDGVFRYFLGQERTAEAEAI